MSETVIETDEQREARKVATLAIGKDAHGQTVYGLMAIDPRGHLLQLSINSKLKAGWRYATPEDGQMKLALERDRQLRETEAESPSEPAPSAPPSSPASEG